MRSAEDGDDDFIDDIMSTVNGQRSTVAIRTCLLSVDCCLLTVIVNDVAEEHGVGFGGRYGFVAIACAEDAVCYGECVGSAEADYGDASCARCCCYCCYVHNYKVKSLRSTVDSRHLDLIFLLYMVS